MKARQAIAFLALGGALVSAYLLLHRLGMSALACGVGRCEFVQASPYAVFLGVPVAGWGLLGYVTILAVAIAGTHPAWSRGRAIGPALVALGALGFTFSTYLTYVELFVLHAICQWCIVSYAVISAIFVLALVAWIRERRGERARPEPR